jgi:hypothetical protein
MPERALVGVFEPEVQIEFMSARHCMSLAIGYSA